MSQTKVIAANRWNLARILVLVLLATASYSTGVHLCTNRTCSGHVQNHPNFCDPQAETLELFNVWLNRLFPDLGKRVPRVKLVRLFSPSIIFSSPTQEQRDNIIACREAEELLMMDPFSWSPYNIGWIKFFFPNINTVRVVPGALPVQSEEDIVVYSADEFKMESVRHFLLFADSSASATAQIAPLLFENLRLFPNLRTIHLGCGKFTVPEHAQGAAVVLPHVEFIDLAQVLADQELLNRLQAALPQLKVMTINVSIFHELMNKNSTGASISPFEHLTDLHINCWFTNLNISAQIGTVFPLLSRIVINRPGTINLLPGSSKSIESVESVEIFFGKKELPTNFFESLFPGLPENGLKQIYCGDRVSPSPLRGDLVEDMEG